ncbi:cytochrome P450 [Xylariaceae sp. FL1019]|nr:cytochrome P450 [Xylariaceae sp. FL1019]
MALIGMILSVATYAGCIGILYGLWTIVYRIRGHPLRRCPGPFLGALTDAYGGYLAFKRRDHLAIHQLHEIYGPVVRFAPDRLVFNSLQAFQDIYQSPRFTKSYLYLYSRDKDQPTTFSTIEAEAHRKRRRLISQPISQRAMHLFEPTMLTQIDIFLRQIYKSSGLVENLTNRAEWLGIDIIGIMSFGYYLNLQTDKTYRFIPQSFADIKARINTFMQFPILSWVTPLITYFTEPGKDQLLRMVFMMMQARAERPRDAEMDFYSHAKGSLDYGPDYFEYGEFMAEAAFFVTAGGTPPATVICALVFYLMRYPECYRRLCKEIRGTFSSGHDIKGDGQLMGCQYLRACIDETMRMSPPSLTTLWREHDKSDPDESPLTVDGLIIPPGVQVGVNMYSLHHNEEYFPDSFVFSPERWCNPGSPQVSETGRSRKNVEQAFVPFLRGTRSCAGKAMAYHEISLTVAKLLWYFDIESAPGKAGTLGEGEPGRTDGRHRVREYQMEDCNSATHDGPNVVFHPRSEAAVDLK